MRKFIEGCATKKEAEKLCRQDQFGEPAAVVKVCGGYLCFQTVEDYRIWRAQK